MDNIDKEIVFFSLFGALALYSIYLRFFKSFEYRKSNHFKILYIGNVVGVVAFTYLYPLSIVFIAPFTLGVVWLHRKWARACNSCKKIYTSANQRGLVWHGSSTKCPKCGQEMEQLYKG